MCCSIFMASMTTSVCPASTRSPAAARTSRTTPGMGATRPPLTSSLPGTVKRGATENPTVPEGTWTQRSSPERVTRPAQRRPSTSTSMPSGDQSWIRAVEEPFTVNEPSRCAR